MSFLGFRKKNQRESNLRADVDFGFLVFENTSEVIQAENILKKFNVRTNQLPYIMSNDKGLEDLDIRPGDIIKITRKSPTAGESVYYRYVVQG